MTKAIFRIGWRNALKNRYFTLISLSSLTLGITLFFFISIWIRDELSYDAHFRAEDQICRVETELLKPDGGSAPIGGAIGWPAGRLLAQYPEIESLTYLRDWQPAVTLKEARYHETGLYADQHFFNVFGYELQEGNPATALAAPYSVVLTPALKEKYFGSEEAMGKTIMLSDTIPYTVTGVFRALPENSHLKFDMIGSFSSICSSDPQYCKDEFASGWFNVNVYNYVRLKKTADRAATAAKIKNLVLTNGQDAVKETGFKMLLHLRPVGDIYLHSKSPTGKGTLGNALALKVFLLIGVFILLIACLNFINLSTARSVERAREIGVQKVLGNSQSRLILQFLAEASLFCLFSALAGLLLVMVLLPYFNSFTGKELAISSLFSLTNMLILAGIIIVLVPLAGFYPAWVLSSYKPIAVLKGNFVHSPGGNRLRKALVVTQFIISAGFIMSTLIIWKQMRFMRERDLGFDKENVLIVQATKVPWILRHDKADVFKSSLLRNSGIKNVSASTAVPGKSGWNGQFAYPEGKTKADALSVEYIPVDADYITTLGLSLQAGRDFIPGSKADEEEAFIINEAAVQYFGWGSANDALGKKLSSSGKDGKVVGVLKNYHQHGLQREIKAVVLSPQQFINTFAIRYSNITPQQVIAQTEAAWNEVYKGYPAELKFLDDDFQQQYQKEEKQQRFFGLAAMLSIVISCLGLLGLAIHTTQKRVREIGLRKVMGASTANIVTLLSLDMLKPVGLSVLVSVPLVWWVMQIWLEQFAYRITISWWIFAVTGLAALLIAGLTISFHSMKAALTNPASSLRGD